MVSEKPEASTEEEASDDERPDRGFGLGVHLAGLIGGVGGRPRADGVGDVVGAVGDGHHHRGRDLGVGPEMFDFVVVAFGVGVGFLDVVISEGDAVAGHALEEDVFDVGEYAFRVQRGEVFGGG